MLLTVIVAAILYSNGEAAARGVIRFGRRLAGDRGEEVVRLAGSAVRGVALGIVVTALAQTVLSGIGLAVAGIPFAALLTALIFVLCIAQVGPLVVLLGAVIWLYYNGHSGWATALLIWSIGGGLLAFGIIGLFVGPVVLAVTYRLLERWVAEVDDPPRST